MPPTNATPQALVRGKNMDQKRLEVEGEEAARGREDKWTSGGRRKEGLRRSKRSEKRGEGEPISVREKQRSHR